MLKFPIREMKKREEERRGERPRSHRWGGDEASRACLSVSPVGCVGGVADETHAPTHAFPILGRGGNVDWNLFIWISCRRSRVHLSQSAAGKHNCGETAGGVAVVGAGGPAVRTLAHVHVRPAPDEARH